MEQDNLLDPIHYLSEVTQHLLRTFLKISSAPKQAFFQGFRGNQKVIQQIFSIEKTSDVFATSIDQEESPCALIICHPEHLFSLSLEEILLAEQLRERQCAFFIVNLEVTQLYPVVHLSLGTEKLVTEEVLHLFSQEGPLSQKIKGYESREPQIEMVQEICQAYNCNKHLLIEAGTGTGKSFAYLVPSILLAIQHRERCVISTHTIHLQEQLLQKDIPQLQQSLNLSFDAVLLKGRTNYLCKRKLQENADSIKLLKGDPDPVQKEILQIREWATTATEGSLSELPFVPSTEAWDWVKSQTETSLRKDCQFYESCFYYQSRRKATKAQLVIVNHHLLLADLNMREEENTPGILPVYTRIVLDEAHHLEEVATTYFGQQSSQFEILKILGRILPPKSKKQKGFLSKIQKELHKYSDELSLQLDGFLGEISHHHQDFLDEVVEAFTQFYQNLHVLHSAEGTLRITEEIRQHTVFSALREEGETLVQNINEYIYVLQELRTRLKRVFTDQTPEEMGILKELESFLLQLNNQGQVITLCLLQDSPEEIRWIEFKKNGNFLTFHLSPLQIAPILKEKLFEPYSSVILTSATLSTNENFSFIKNRLGLDLLSETRLSERILSSPFDYPKQCILAVPTDGLLPTEIGYDRHIFQFSAQVIRILGGRIFLLFTSFKSMIWVYEELQKEFPDQKILFLKQGALPRSTLLKIFKENSSSVLLGVDSFWEGVDVPGDALSVVILTKLPFPVPSEPVIQARMEYLEKQGQDAFRDFTLPQAIIKLKQGFGRLIRTSTDRGIVYILDRRILTKSYGKAFFKSLPPAQTDFRLQSELLKDLPVFFEDLYG
ncbi:MAG: helicase C-terminal domain-containing protein, partial [Planctomycetota bacterium]